MSFVVRRMKRSELLVKNEKLTRIVGCEKGVCEKIGICSKKGIVDKKNKVNNKENQQEIC